MESRTVADDGPLHVVIAEGQGLVRAAFRVLLEHEGMIVTAEAATADEAVGAAPPPLPTSCSWTSTCPTPAGGGDAHAPRRGADGSTRVVMLMTSDSDEAVLDACARRHRSSAQDANPGELLAAVRSWPR